MNESKNFSWRLGEYMIQRGWISFDQLQEALRQQGKLKHALVPNLEGKPVFSKETRTELSLGEILVRNTWVTWEQLEACLNEQSQCRKRIGEILLDKGWLQEEQLCRALAIQFNLAYVDLDKESIKSDAIQRVPKALAEEFEMMPLVERAGIFLLAISDPTQEEAQRRLKQVVTGVELHWAVATPSSIKAAQTAYYS